MLATAQDRRTRPRRDQRRRGRGTLLCADPQPDAGVRDDPLCRRAGRRGRSRRQAQAARARHLDHAPAARRSTKRSSARSLPAASSAISRWRRDLADETERLLARSALDALAMAGKAGCVIGGFAKVEAALGRDEVLALIHASDAAEDGKRKLMAALRRNRTEESREIAIIEAFDGTAIGFGIEPPKCGTCCPACRTRERDISRSRRALGALSVRKLARCS